MLNLDPMNYLKFGFFSIVFLGIISTPSFITLERTTTIVVIDGKALLVDLNEKGEIMTTYMEVADYFENHKDHKTKVLEAKATYKRLTKEQMDQIRFIALTDNGWTLDEFMKSNLSDLATHYHQTYANQIEITIAKHPDVEHLIEENVQTIVGHLQSNGVLEQDISINYKKDLGNEATRFIKVVSNLRTLREFE